MARIDGGINSGRDLAGKRLAVNNRNNIMWIRAAAWVDKTGGNVGPCALLSKFHFLRWSTRW